MSRINDFDKLPEPRGSHFAVFDELPDDYHKKPITVAEAIERLKQLPQDSKLIVPDWDSEYMGTHYTHVYGFSNNGHVLNGLCKEDWYEEDELDYEEEEDEND